MTVANDGSKVEASVKDGGAVVKKFEETTSIQTGKKWNSSGTAPMIWVFRSLPKNMMYLLQSLLGQKKDLTKKVIVKAETFDSSATTLESGKEITIRVPVKLKGSKVKIFIKAVGGDDISKDFGTTTTKTDYEVVVKTWDGKKVVKMLRLEIILYLLDYRAWSRRG